MSLRRVRLRARVLLSVAALAVLAPGLPVTPARAATDWAAVAYSLPHDQLLRIWRGTEADRSGQILVVPQQPNFLGSNFPHSGPWDYLQDVPMLWYGPGYLKPQPAVQRPVTIAGIAPTTAGLLQFDGFDAPDGSALPEVLAAAPDTPPKLIVTMVWDAGGRSVLDTWPNGAIEAINATAMPSPTRQWSPAGGATSLPRRSATSARSRHWSSP